MLSLSVGRANRCACKDCEDHRHNRIWSKQLYDIHSAWHNCMHHCFPSFSHPQNKFFGFIFCCSGWDADVVHEGQHWAAKTTFLKRFDLSWGNLKCSLFHLFPFPPLSVWLYFWSTCSDCDYFPISDHQYVFKVLYSLISWRKWVE